MVIKNLKKLTPNSTQKTGPPVTPAPRTTVTAPGAGTNRPAGNRTAAASKPRPAGAKTSSGADSSATE